MIGKNVASACFQTAHFVRVFFKTVYILNTVVSFYCLKCKLFINVKTKCYSTKLTLPRHVRRILHNTPDLVAGSSQQTDLPASVCLLYPFFFAISYSYFFVEIVLCITLESEAADEDTLDADNGKGAILQLPN